MTKVEGYMAGSKGWKTAYPNSIPTLSPVDQPNKILHYFQIGAMLCIQVDDYRYNIEIELTKQANELKSKATEL